MKRTYQPSVLVSKRRHGFRIRLKKHTLVLKARKLKKRRSLSH